MANITDSIKYIGHKDAKASPLGNNTAAGTITAIYRIITLLTVVPTAMSMMAQTLAPQNGAKNVCTDTHLVLTFAHDVKMTHQGMVRVYDTQTGDCIDSIDTSIPDGPTASRTYGPECDYTHVPYDYTRTTVPTNRTVRPGTPSGGATPTYTTPPDYQLNIIGGFTDAFHYRPILTAENRATICLHNNVLEYGRQYRVTIDRRVFENHQGINDWTFTTRASAPRGRTLHVNADGSADYCTVQGALDAIPDHAEKKYNIYVAEGDYEEIVYARNKRNVHIKGAGMGRTRVHYANCEVFNPHPLNLKTNEYPGTFPSRRAAFMLDNCQDITMEDICVASDMQGQAEGLLVNGERIALRRVHIIGSGDAMQGNGTIYMEACEMDGGGDTFLGRGTIYLYRCNLRNDGGPFTWVRNTEGHHGDVFVECTFSTNNGRRVDFGRSPSNKGKTYPHAEQVMIDCRTTETIPMGWSAIGEPTAFYAEYNTRDLTTGQPVDTSRRHQYARQLDAQRDKQLIKNYRSPAYVLKGWKPKF